MTRSSRLSVVQLAIAAALLLAVGPMRAAAMPSSAAESHSRWVEPQAGGWHTWVLASGGAVRPGPPPDGAATQLELDQLRALAQQRDAIALDQIAFWDTGAPSYRWNELAVTAALRHN